MGIVVSEDGNVGGLDEQQKLDIIAAENDYGLVMATLDQVSVFLGSWWTSSLSSRIQVSLLCSRTENLAWDNVLTKSSTRPSRATLAFPC